MSARQHVPRPTEREKIRLAEQALAILRADNARLAALLAGNPPTQRRPELHLLPGGRE